MEDVIELMILNVYITTATPSIMLFIKLIFLCY